MYFRFACSKKHWIPRVGRWFWSVAYMSIWVIGPYIAVFDFHAIHDLFAGSEGFDKIFVPEKLSRGSCVGSNGFTPPSNTTGENAYSSTMESTVVSLEELVADSQSKCAALTAGLCNSESSIQHLAEIEQLTQKLESMQSLLTRLRTHIWLAFFLWFVCVQVGIKVSQSKSLCILFVYR